VGFAKCGGDFAADDPASAAAEYLAQDELAALLSAQF